MGSSYASVQIRPHDRDALMSMIESMAITGDVQFLCGPVIDGWVGVYPSKQVDAFARTLASRCNDDIFYLALHDDAVTEYRYFSGGKLRDRYWSRPGHLHFERFYAEDAQFGAPEVYRHLIGGDVARAKAILDRGIHTIRKLGSERQRLAAFASLLGIANAETSYQRLEGDKGDGVRDWARFVHVPDRSAAPKRDKATKAKPSRKVAHKQLIDDGVLLAVEELDPQAKSFTVTVRDKPVEVGFSDDSRRLGVAHPNGGYVVKRGTVGRAADAVEIVAQDGSPSRKLLAGAQTAAEAMGRPGPSKGVMKLHATVPALTKMPTGEALAAILAVVPPELQQLAEESIRRVLPPSPWTAEQAAALVQLATRAMIKSDLIHDLLITDDGRWLACATARGLRVAAWDDLIAAADGSPTPWRYTFDIPPYRLVVNGDDRHTYAITYDAATNGIVFGGLDGRLRLMSLADGHVTNLVETYERATVARMRFVDRDTLATLVWPEHPAAQKQAPKGLLYVWNFPAVRERALAGKGPVDPPLEPHALVEIVAGKQTLPHVRMLATLRAAHGRSPKEIQLQPLQEVGWPNEDICERLVEPLLQAGFQSTLPFRIAPFDNLCVQLSTHTELCMTAALTTMRDRGTILDLIAEHEDGRAFWVTNRRPNGLDAPPGREICHAEGVDANGLLYLMTRHRPRIQWLSFTVDELAKRFEERYAKQHAWRDEHGFSAAEAMRALTSERGS